MQKSNFGYSALRNKRQRYRSKLRNGGYFGLRPAGDSNGYLYRKTITIDSSKVPGDQTNFPVGIIGTYAYLATTANGGAVTDSNGYDIIFTSDAAGTTQLDHEIELYTSTTGQVVFWVRIPTLLSGSNSTFYMFYGNSSITTSQENVSGTWDANFKAVNHLDDLTTSTIEDSTSNNNDGAKVAANEPIEATGKIGKGQDFDGTNDIITISHSASLTQSSEITVSCWVFSNNYDDSYAMPVVKSSGDAGPWQLRMVSTNRTPQFCINASANDAVSSDALVNGNWYYLACTYDKDLASDNIKIYVNGVEKGTANYATSIVSDADDLLIGARNDGFYFDGIVDELRISAVDRGANWVLTEYNNMNSPSTFYSIA